MIKQNKSIIYLEMYLYRAKKLIINKDCTAEDLNEAAMYLNICRNLASSKETRIDVWFGKLELKRSRMSRNSLDREINLEDAKNSFFMSLSQGYNQPAHYGLYKIAVIEEDFARAKEHLLEYEKGGRKNHYNFTLVHKLLDTCMGVDCKYPTADSDFIFSNRINYPALLVNYRLAENAFDSGHYNRCLKHLLVCQKLAVLKNIAMDFSQVIRLIAKIIEVKNIKQVDELKAKILKTENFGERIMLIRKLITISPKEIELYFMLIDSYISIGVYACIPDILMEISNQEPSEIDIKRMAYYDNLAREQTQHARNFLNIYSTLNNGDTSASNGELEQAYHYYLSGLKNSGHSVFLSKIGDLFYKNGYYRQAEQYYLEYLEIGYEKKFSVYVNLYKIYRHLNNDEKATSIASISFQNLFLDSKGYTLTSWFNQLDCEYHQEFDSGETVISKVKELELATPQED